MAAIITVEPPYHFGWKNKDDPCEEDAPNTMWQEVDLEKRNTDIMLYKDDKIIGWWKVIK